MPAKRPAAKEASNHTQKKSKTGEDEERNVALSKEALANHEKFLEELAKKEEMSEKDFSQALAILPEKQVQLLWKKFEASWKSSDQDKKYKEETNGAGSVAKKKSLLLSWAMDGAKCDKHYKALVKKVQESQKNGQAALKQVTAHLAGKTGAKTELAKVLTQACTALKDLKSKKQMAAKAMKH